MVENTFGVYATLIGMSGALVGLTAVGVLTTATRIAAILDQMRNKRMELWKNLSSQEEHDVGLTKIGEPPRRYRLTPEIAEEIVKDQKRHIDNLTKFRNRLLLSLAVCATIGIIIPANMMLWYPQAVNHTYGKIIVMFLFMMVAGVSLFSVYRVTSGIAPSAKKDTTVNPFEK